MREDTSFTWRRCDDEGTVPSTHEGDSILGHSIVIDSSDQKTAYGAGNNQFVVMVTADQIAAIRKTQNLIYLLIPATKDEVDDQAKKTKAVDTTILKKFLVALTSDQMELLHDDCAKTVVYYRLALMPEDNESRDTDNAKVSEQAKDTTWSPMTKIAMGVAATGAVVATGGLALTAAGFGASGIVAGSTAASVQSGIGNVVAGSWFAWLQSAGATGAIASATSSGACTAAASGAAVAASAAANHKAKGNSGSQSQQQSSENQEIRKTPLDQEDDFPSLYRADWIAKSFDARFLGNE